MGPLRGAASTSALPLSEKSEVEGYEYQNNSYIHGQPFPEPVLEEQEIHTDHNGYHEQWVKDVSRPASHFSHPVQQEQTRSSELCAKRKGAGDNIVVAFESSSGRAHQYFPVSATCFQIAFTPIIRR